MIANTNSQMFDSTGISRERMVGAAAGAEWKEMAR
jgi:hypothetical protein